MDHLGGELVVHNEAHTLVSIVHTVGWRGDTKAEGRGRRGSL